ncbi:hypothetical protein MKO06_16700 [Gramella sp. GC03-9]|uniref:Uncharacterized protein n=1 Tax=Christiangramia oceanisediminis TaxID=2920386 RepID=A0A9X2L0F7_9FLAO|nr:hypothetical protein [Gramella oceanisediminis]MCP9201552.1 hypothetical protein [Gramella oceanisediminis]
MKYLIYLSIFFISVLTQAQNPVNSGDLSDGFKIMRNDLKGSPFLTQKWYVGHGVLKDGKLTTPQIMNYDIHGNNLVYKANENEDVLKLLDNNFTGFILKAETGELIFTKIPGEQFEKNKKDTKYYQIVNPPSRLVVTEFYKELDDPNASGWTSSTQSTKSAEYDLEVDYYVLNPKNKYEEVKLKERAILKIFDDKKKELESFINSNDIDINSPEDLFKIVEHYYSLK